MHKDMTHLQFCISTHHIVGTLEGIRKWISNEAKKKLDKLKMFLDKHK